MSRKIKMAAPMVRQVSASFHSYFRHCFRRSKPIASRIHLEQYCDVLCDYSSTTHTLSTPHPTSKSRKTLVRKRSEKEIREGEEQNLTDLVLQQMDLTDVTDAVHYDSPKSTKCVPQKLGVGINLHSLPPSVKSAGNIAVYARDSEALTKLVELGVDLSQVERNAEATDLFVKMDFKKNVVPYLTFLNQLNVPDTLLAQCITRNPMIFAESLEDLQLRIDYLFSKQFSSEQIIGLVTRAPQFLSLSTIEIDGKLGYLQKKFHLTGELHTTIFKVYSTNYINLVYD